MQGRSDETPGERLAREIALISIIDENKGACRPDHKDFTTCSFLVSFLGQIRPLAI